MRLSSMADYAVVAMTAAARHGDTAVAGAKRSSMNAALLAEESGLPAPTVQKLVSRLVAAGCCAPRAGRAAGWRWRARRTRSRWPRLWKLSKGRSR
jgi:DNA-binding IscR family transcriptional regulator